MLRVAITDGTQRQYVNLLSSQKYTELGGFFIDYIDRNAPALNLAYINDPTLRTAYTEAILNALISPAHASIFSDIGSSLWSAINWVIPLEDFYILGQQLVFLATNNPSFDPIELSLAAVGAISIIPTPATKPLKAVVNPLRRLLRIVNTANPKFIKAFGSVIGRTAQKAFKKRSIDDLINIAPFLIIGGEMVADEESREALLIMIKSIQSDDDLFAWIDYLALPTDGWEGKDVPSVELANWMPVEENPWYRNIASGVLNKWGQCKHNLIKPDYSY